MNGQLRLAVAESFRYFILLKICPLFVQVKTTYVVSNDINNITDWESAAMCYQDVWPFYDFF